MPRFSDIYGGNYMSAQMCDRENLWNRELTITEVRDEQIRDRRKLVLHFGETGRELALNKTNGATIADKYGDDTQGWIGKVIRLVKTKQSFQGKLVDAIQVVV